MNVEIERLPVTPIVRESVLSKYDYTCQKCGLRLKGACQSLLWLDSVPIVSTRRRDLTRGWQVVCVHCSRGKPSYYPMVEV